MATPVPPSPTDPQRVHHTSARERRGRDKPRMQLQTTPMIDIIFLLLIYFVVTASFAVDEGVLATKLPEGDSDQTQSVTLDDEVLNIELTSIDVNAVQIRVDALEADGFDELFAQLLELQYDPDADRHGFFPPSAKVLVTPDGQVRWQHVTNALNAAVRAGYTNVRFAPTGS